MQNEATNAMQERMVKNPHMAAQLRQKLKRGWPQDGTFCRIVDSLSNTQLVEKYFAHMAVSKMPLDMVEKSSIEA